MWPPVDGPGSAWPESVCAAAVRRLAASAGGTWCLVLDVAGGLLEDDVVQREPVLERPHHLELVQQAVVGVELRVCSRAKGNCATDVDAFRYYMRIMNSYSNS